MTWLWVAGFFLVLIVLAVEHGQRCELVRLRDENHDLRVALRDQERALYDALFERETLDV